jgi:hypothetical protein
MVPPLVDENDSPRNGRDPPGKPDRCRDQFKQPRFARPHLHQCKVMLSERLDGHDTPAEKRGRRQREHHSSDGLVRATTAASL